MSIPRWETATSPAVVLDIQPRPPLDGEPGPYAAADCESGLQEITLSFALANDRDQGVGEEERLRVGEAVIRPRAALMADSVAPEQGLVVDQLTLEIPGEEPVALTAEITSVAWIKTPRDRPPLLTLLHDHGRRTAEIDTADERVEALAEIAEEALCSSGEAQCPLNTEPPVSLLRLANDSVTSLVQRAQDMGTIQSALDDLRATGETGEAPLFLQSDGRTPGGLPRSLEACDPADLSFQCWSAVTLITAEMTDPGDALPSSALEPGSRFFFAGLEDSPALRRLACQSGGFFWRVSHLPDLRLLTNRSTTDIPDYGYGFARRVLLAMHGRWEVGLTLMGLPEGLDPGVVAQLGGTLSVTFGDQRVSTDFTAALGGY